MHESCQIQSLLYSVQIEDFNRKVADLQGKAWEEAKCRNELEITRNRYFSCLLPSEWDPYQISPICNPQFLSQKALKACRVSKSTQAASRLMGYYITVACLEKSIRQKPTSPLTPDVH